MAGSGPTTKPGQAQAEISPLTLLCTNTCLSNLYHILHGCCTSCSNTIFNKHFHCIVTPKALVERQSLRKGMYLCSDHARLHP